MAKKMIDFNRELFDLLSSRLSSSGYETEVRKMFGHVVHFLNGYMFAGANEHGIYLHVGEKIKEDALGSEKWVRTFSPLEGTVMREYILLEREGCADADTLKKWTDRSRAYLLSLPPKKKRGGTSSAEAP